MNPRSLLVVGVVVLSVVGMTAPAVGYTASHAAGATDCEGRTSAPSQLDIGEAQVGESASASYTFKNPSEQEIEITGLSVGGADASAFSVSGGTGTVGPGECKTITVTFTPDRTGDFDASLSVNAEGGSESTSLDGEGLEPRNPDAGISPSQKNVGTVRVGSSAETSIVISNTGDAPLEVGDVSLSGPGDFSVVSGGGTTVDPGGTTTVTVQFTPSSRGQASATLSVPTNDSEAGTLTATVRGEGIETDLSVSPTSFNFGQVPAGDSRELTATITNTGTEPVDLSSVRFPGTNQSVFRLVSTDAGSTLDPNESASVTVEFAPQRARSYGGTVLVETGSEDAPTISLSLSGQGVAPDINVAPKSINFGKTVTSDVVTRQVTVANRGKQPLEVSSTSIGGANPSAFQVISGGGSFTVEPGSSHTVTVQFAPGEAGQFSASLVVASNDPANPTTTVYLSNTQTTVKQESQTSENGTRTSNVEVNDAEADDTITLVLGSGDGGQGNQVLAAGAAADVQAAQDNASLSVMNITLAESADFGLGITDSPRKLRTTPEFYLHPRNGTDAVGYLNVSHTISDDTIAEVEFTHQVSKRTLAQLNASIEDYALYRFHDGEWVELNTTVVDEGESYYEVKATSPGLSDFTSGVKQPKFRLVDGNVTVTKITAGENVGVRVDIRNDGGADGTYTATLLLDGESVAKKDVTIAPETKRVITFEQEIDESGTYTVVVNNVTISDVEVTAEELDSTATATSASGDEAAGDGDSEATETTNTESPGFGVVAAILAMLAGSLLLRRRD